MALLEGYTLHAELVKASDILAAYREFHDWLSDLVEEPNASLDDHQTAIADKLERLACMHGNQRG